MRQFLASGFSRGVAGLLTLLFLMSKQIYSEEVMTVSRAEVPAKNKWNVEALYQNPSAWKKELSSVNNLSKLSSYQGRLSDPKILKEFLDHYIDLDRKLNKLHTYAHLRVDEDLTNDEFKANYGEVSALAQDFRVSTAWFEPELLNLADSVIKDPSLKEYQFYFDGILRARPHTLSSDKEELLALSGKALQAPQKAFSALNNADLKFKDAEDSQGNKLALTNGSYGTLIQSQDRTLRKSAMLNLHEGFGSHINTTCELLQGHIQNHLFNAKARNFEDCITASLFWNCIDPKVERQLIATVKKNRSIIEEYISLRKSALKLDEIHLYDMNCALVPEAEIKISYDDACQTVISSVEPLGKSYQDALRQGLLKDGWVDPFENKGKRSGAYSSGCYDSMPYILMNFHNTVYDTMTLAHEAGHSMHSYLSRKNQPPIYSQYSIFVAEVASTFNEQLLADELMKKVKTKREKAYLINDQIDRIRGTLIRQTMFAEFELKIHELVEQGQSLTPTLLNKLYADLLREYYGPELVIDKELESEWSRIPHFYYNFYVYQYATGVSAAMALHAQVTASEVARDKYLKFLSSGSSKYPLDVLKDAGVDMTTSAPIEAAMKRFAYLVGELKKNLE